MDHSERLSEAGQTVKFTQSFRYVLYIKMQADTMGRELTFKLTLVYPAPAYMLCRMSFRGKFYRTWYLLNFCFISFKTIKKF
jgi:hypothetical protein